MPRRGRAGCGARGFASRIYGTGDDGLHPDLLGTMLSVVCVQVAGICPKRAPEVAEAGNNAEEKDAQGAAPETSSRASLARVPPASTWTCPATC